MTQWEYETAYLANDYHAPNRARMNDLGKQGWELVAVEKDIAYFKRPLHQVPLVVEKLASMHVLQEVAA